MNVCEKNKILNKNASVFIKKYGLENHNNKIINDLQIILKEWMSLSNKIIDKSNIDNKSLSIFRLMSEFDFTIGSDNKLIPEYIKSLFL